jgi:CrcB protein
MVKILVVGIGGFIGANLRYWASIGALRLTDAFPVGTMAVNIIGCFGLALFAGLIHARLDVADETRLLIATGFFGALTTFSTFSLEAFDLFIDGRQLTAAVYLAGSIVLGLIGILLGTGLANSL